MKTSEARRGLTWVEVLVAVVIVVGLLVVLLPLIQSMREASRRKNCMHHMMQLGLAMLEYNSANGSFPATAKYEGG
ncbi:MAG: DUF1559 domain-containing protein, partial [Thermoguttaceae bacterium]